MQGFALLFYLCFLTACSNPPKKIRIKNKALPCGNALLFIGGERGIRTPGALLTHTRFPIVRLRPAQPSLQQVTNVIINH